MQAQLKPTSSGSLDYHVRAHDGLASHAAITKALEPYFTAARTGEPGLLREIWRDSARISGWIDGTPLTLDPDAFAQWISDNDASPNLEYQIASIDTSGSVARIKIELGNWLGFRFTDFFLLNRGPEGWRITSKVYDSHARAGRPLAVSAASGDEDSYAEVEAIRRVIDEYVEGARAGDEKRLRAIWFDHACITGWRKGALVDLGADAFCRNVAEAKGAPDVQAQIVSIDRSGVAASARIELRDWNGVRFTDFLALLNGPEGWRISGKVFDAHDNSEIA